jgi:hypothetical protein
MARRGDVICNGYEMHQIETIADLCGDAGDYLGLQPCGSSARSQVGGVLTHDNRNGRTEEAGGAGDAGGVEGRPGRIN